jgi:hypothetical protein
MSVGERYESEDISTSARQRGIVLEVARHVMWWYSDLPIGMNNIDRVQIVKRCRKLPSDALVVVGCAGRVRVQIVGERSRVFEARRPPLSSLRYRVHVTLAHGGIVSSQHNPT